MSIEMKGLDFTSYGGVDLIYAAVLRTQTATLISAPKQSRGPCDIYIGPLHACIKSPSTKFFATLSSLYEGEISLRRHHANGTN